METIKTGNKSYLPSIFLILMVFGVYFEVVLPLITDWWTDSNYSHGFLIPFISIYFIWQKRGNLANLLQEKSNLGLILLIIGLGIYIIGTAAAEFFSVRFSLILVILGITLYFYGKKLIKEIWFPILFLIFMIPIPYVIYYSITFPMQLFSTKAATFLIQLAGFNVLRQGNIIHLSNYSLEVAEACSGLRSLITLSALGAAIAYMTQKTIFSAIFLFLLSVPIAIAANVFRILFTAFGAVMISPKFADGFLHEMSGLVVFLIGFISLGIAASVIRWMGNLKNYEPTSN